MTSGERSRLPYTELQATLTPIFAAHSLPVHLVGGAVRDALLGRPIHDLDFVVPTGAIALAFATGDRLGAPAFALSAEHDIGRVVLGRSRTTIDFARYRGPNLLTDLRERDFTVNAMAVPASEPIRRDLVIDPTGGLDDLAHRRLRLTHQQALSHDPLRALRAVRLAHELDFVLGEDTRLAIQQVAHRLITIAPERIRDELLRMLGNADPAAALQSLDDLGLLAATLPELADLRDVTQSTPHFEPVLAHSLSALRAWLALESLIVDAGENQPGRVAETRLSRAEAAGAGEILQRYAAGLRDYLLRTVDGGLSGALLLRLALLLHDIGKSRTRTEEDGGRVRFLGHDVLGAELAAARLRRLALSRAAVDHIRQVVAAHMRPLNLSAALPLTRRAVFRYFRDTGSAGLDVVLLSLADGLSLGHAYVEGESWPRQLNVARSLLAAYFEQQELVILPSPVVTGDELMAALSLQPGPLVGSLLRLIQEGQAAGEIHTAEQALQLAQRHLDR
jgi:putative nucleotidyltransferase with HDIG domain